MVPGPSGSLPAIQWLGELLFTPSLIGSVLPGSYQVLDLLSIACKFYGNNHAQTLVTSRETVAA